MEANELGVNFATRSHLDGTVLHSGGVVLDTLSRPSLMITDAYNANIVHPARKHRDAALFDSIMDTLQRNCSVLLPTDSAARVLELAYLLDQHWSFHHLSSYPLILLSHTSYHTTHFAKIMLEWMGDAVTKQFSQARENPYDFKYLRLCHRREDLDRYPGPKVVVASNLSLETGYARQLFLEWMGEPAVEKLGDSKFEGDEMSDVREKEKESAKNNALILTDRGPPGTLARELYEKWEKQTTVKTEADDAAQQQQQQPVKPSVELAANLKLTVRRKIPLEGAELLEHQSAQRAKIEREAAQAAMIARSKTIMEEDDLMSEGSESDEALEDANADVEDLLIGKDQFDLYVRDAAKSGGFFKQTQSYRMFPFSEKRKRFDDYGEVIAPEHYVRSAAEAADIAGLPAPNGGTGANFGGRDEDADVRMDEPILPPRDEVPTKYVAYDEEIHILVHGSEEATRDLEQACLSMDQMTREVFAPDVGEVLNVSAATNIYQVKLTDALVSSLKFSKLDDYELARISGRIHFPADSTTPTLDIAPADEIVVPSPESSLGAAISANANSSGWHAPVFVGDIRLTDFKRVLQAAGITAEFRGEGVLVCNEQVAVRKTATGQLLLEGLLSEDYFKIRTLLYAQHAIL
ncbi:hypothetical protein BC938DRAFT_478934 [Jimgerdemannia flammicorona]|uniref:Cleavage and polyadenylation specificity factor subunit 2 n=1 Tax=Jimgerdemannia flammicorona TaxID=994334 RepID=A0A433QM00_9FUNG|nr:hypothetical protein BC938DRAFT_478934 [Jimgerdemannia flammicorona]